MWCGRQPREGRKREREVIFKLMIQLTKILFESGWDDFDIDPRTGRLIAKKNISIPKEEPDGPIDGPLGAYVFGDLRKDIGKNIDEPDTELEKRIYNALVFYANFNNKNLLNTVAEEMKEISDKGLYPKYFEVPSAIAWRVLLGLTKDSLQKLIGHFTENVGVVDDVTIVPRSDTKVTGWSLDPNSMKKIYSQAKFESSETFKGYCLLAKCETNNNPFFFNIDAALPYLSVGGSSYEYQKEVLAYDIVKATKVAYKLVEGEENPVPQLLRLING